MILKHAMSLKQTLLPEGYIVLPLKASATSTATHYVYIKQHQTKASDDGKPCDRTLLVLNVPPFVSKDDLQRLFLQCGKVETVHVHKKPTSRVVSDDGSDFFSKTPPVVGHKVAYIVFHRPKSLERALSLTFDYNFVLYDDKHKPCTGLQKWTAEYHSRYVDVDTLQSQINSYMEQYDSRVQQEKLDAQAQDGQADDDGWITVTKHSKTRGFSRTDANERRLMEREKRKRKERELLDFYSFQQRETKREHLATLRKQFEEDKRKVAQMKSARKFKPF